MREYYVVISGFCLDVLLVGFCILWLYGLYLVCLLWFWCGEVVSVRCSLFVDALLVIEIFMCYFLWFGNILVD